MQVWACGHFHPPNHHRCRGFLGARAAPAASRWVTGAGRRLLWADGARPGAEPHGGKAACELAGAAPALLMELYRCDDHF